MEVIYKMEELSLSQEVRNDMNEMEREVNEILSFVL